MQGRYLNIHLFVFVSYSDSFLHFKGPAHGTSGVDTLKENDSIITSPSSQKNLTEMFLMFACFVSIALSFLCTLLKLFC